MNSLPMGIYLENEKRFEFDFVKHLLRISYLKGTGQRDSIVSPFRVVRNNDEFFLLIHNFDRTGDRKIMIESIDNNELVINHENTSYKLRKVA